MGLRDDSVRAFDAERAEAEKTVRGIVHRTLGVWPGELSMVRHDSGDAFAFTFDRVKFRVRKSAVLVRLKSGRWIEIFGKAELGKLIREGRV